MSAEQGRSPGAGARVLDYLTSAEAGIERLKHYLGKQSRLWERDTKTARQWREFDAKIWDMVEDLETQLEQEGETK